jgi:HNH endonuclease
MCLKTMATVRYIGRDVPEEIAIPLLRKRLESRARMGANGCWEWPGFVLPNGYCETSAWGRGIRVHRLSYRIFKGPVPPDMDVLHSCDNTICFNPDHLSLGLDKQNIGESIARGRRNTARPGRVRNPGMYERNECSRGHKLEGENLYITPDKRRQCRTCRGAAARRWKPKPPGAMHA